MRTSTRVAILLLTLAGLVGLGGFSTSASGVEEGKVTICHATNSNSNPYVVITVDESAVDGVSAGDHFAEHRGPIWTPDLKAQKISWGDVIPPVAPHHDGLNWDPQTSPAFIENGCVVPPVPTHDVTLDKVTTGGAAPSADTVFTFAVECESGTVTSPVELAAQDEAVVVADDVAEDDLCTITETDANGAGATTFEVTGGTVESSTATSVTVAVGAEVAVVATNDFPEATADVTLDKVVTGGTAEDAAATFGFTVVCDTGTEASPVTIEATDDPVLVAEDVVQGDECTVTEAGSNAADDVSFAVTGGTVVSTTDASVTFTVDTSAVSVIATNAFPEVGGEVITPAKPAELPRTGSATPYLALVAAALISVGSVVWSTSRRLDRGRAEG